MKATLTNHGVLSTDVPLVLLQFSFSMNHPMPVCFRELPDETDQEHIKRKTEAVPGKQFIAPGKNNINLTQITHDLEQAGYVLVSAARQLRTNNGHPYNMIRFFFILPDHIDQSTDIPPFRSTCRSMLQLIARDAMWRVRAYRNPYFSDDCTVVPDKWAMSINFEARCGYRDKSGTPIMIYPRDTDGHRTGEPKRPIQPRQVLTVTDNTIMLIPATE